MHSIIGVHVKRCKVPKESSASHFAQSRKTFMTWGLEATWFPWPQSSPSPHPPSQSPFTMTTTTSSLQSGTRRQQRSLRFLPDVLLYGRLRTIIKNFWEYQVVSSKSMYLLWAGLCGLSFTSAAQTKKYFTTKRHMFLWEKGISTCEIHESGCEVSEGRYCTENTKFGKAMFSLTRKGI